MRAMGYRAECADLLQFHDKQPFRVISLADVLEHMPFPRAALDRVHHMLQPDGLVFISMPNMDSLVWKELDRQGKNPYWHELEHYHIFTRERLYQLLNETRFRPVDFAVSQRYISGMEVIAAKADPLRPAEEDSQATEAPSE
jgi:2-polyprenyl-3-methyl-5-hydroxy-6-metoxy-1,4-benzoquinol methylase